MPSRNAKKRPKTSTARRKAEQAVAGGGDFSAFTIPEGMQLWKPKAGVQKIDIVGFEAGKGNPYADAGEFHYERTYYLHPRVGGPNGKAYGCPRRMEDRKCPVCEEQATMSQDPDADEANRKSLIPKQRQLFLIRDHAEPDKGLQLWECSYHLFGKLLDSRIKNSDEEDGYEFFYYPDADGMTLKVTFEEETNPFGKHLEAKHIDFVPRKNKLPVEIAEHGVCLDSIVKVPSYDELRSVFLQLDPATEEEEEALRKQTKGKTKSTLKKATTKSKPEPQDTADEDADWLLAQGRKADKGDDDAIEALNDRAEAVGLDTDDFPKWSDVAKAVLAEEASEEEEDEPEDEDEAAVEEPDDDDWDDEDEEPAPKKTVKKATAKTSTKAKTSAKKQPVPDPEPDDDEDDWDDEPEDENEAEVEEPDDDNDWDDDEDEEPAPKKRAAGKSSASASTAGKRSGKGTKRRG